MKTLKKIGIGLLVLIVLLLVIAYFMPRKMNLSVTSKIDAPSIYAYNILNDFKNQAKWDPWLELDTTIAFEYGDKTIGQDGYVDYSSETYGSGRTIRTVAEPSKKIVLETKTPNGIASMTYDLEDKGKSSNLTWGFTGDMPWPVNILNSLFGMKMKGEMKDGIKNISKMAHKRFKDGIYDGYTVGQSVIEDRNYVTSRDVMPMEKVEQFFARNMGPLFQKIQEAGVEMEGKPSALIYKHDVKNNTLDIAASIPIKEEVAIAGAGTANLIAGKIVTADYYGDPSGTAEAHNAIDAYLMDRGLLYNYPVVEEYVTDPSEEKDPGKWLTKIRYYLAD